MFYICCIHLSSHCQAASIAACISICGGGCSGGRAAFLTANSSNGKKAAGGGYGLVKDVVCQN